MQRTASLKHVFQMWISNCKQQRGWSCWYDINIVETRLHQIHLPQTSTHKHARIFIFPRRTERNGAEWRIHNSNLLLLLSNTVTMVFHTKMMHIKMTILWFTFLCRFGWYLFLSYVKYVIISILLYFFGKFVTRKKYHFEVFQGWGIRLCNQKFSNF